MKDAKTLELPLEQIRAYCKTQPIARLSVFGSAAREKMQPESDVDLLVEYEPSARVSYFDLGRQMLALAEGKTCGDLDDDEQLRLALDRDVEIIAESARNITDEFQAQTPEIPWSAIKGLRPIVAQFDYEIDPDILWKTVVEHVPPLIAQLEAILADEISA